MDFKTEIVVHRACRSAQLDISCKGLHYFIFFVLFMHESDINANFVNMLTFDFMQMIFQNEKLYTIERIILQLKIYFS